MGPARIAGEDMTARTLPKSPPFFLPIEALDADIAILAKKGSGKTYTAKAIVERLIRDGRRVVIFDPVSVWWGLKASADGARPGLPVAVFGGPRADHPLTERRLNKGAAQ